MGDEKRKYPRILKRVIIWYSVDNRQYFGSLTRDLSVGGIQIEVREKVKAGTPVYLEIKIPDHKKIMTAEAVVARVTEHANQNCLLGMEFREISAADKQVIAGFVAKHL